MANKSSGSSHLERRLFRVRVRCKVTCCIWFKMGRRVRRRRRRGDGGLKRGCNEQRRGRVLRRRPRAPPPLVLFTRRRRQARPRRSRGGNGNGPLILHCRPTLTHSLSRPLSKAKMPLTQIAPPQLEGENCGQQGRQSPFDDLLRIFRSVHACCYVRNSVPPLLYLKFEIERRRKEKEDDC